MFSWKQIVGAILFVLCVVVFIVAYRTKKKYMNEIKKIAEGSSSEE